MTMMMMMRRRRMMMTMMTMPFFPECVAKGSRL